MKSKIVNKISFTKLYIVALTIGDDTIIKAGYTARATSERFGELKRKNKATSVIELDTFSVAPYNIADANAKNSAVARALVAETAMHKALEQAGFTPILDKQDGTTEYYKPTSEVTEITFTWKVRKTLSATMKVAL